MSRMLVVVGVWVLFGLSADARAEKRFWGSTPVGQEVVVVTDSTGRVARVSVSWRLRCGGIDPMDVTTTLTPGSRTSTSRSFAAVGGDHAYYDTPPGRRLSIEATITGRRRGGSDRPAAETWAGAFAATVEVTGDPPFQQKRCTVRPARFRAVREGYGRGTWTHASEPGQGSAPAFASTSVSAWGSRRGVLVQAGPATEPDLWTLRLAPREGGALRSGLRFSTDNDGPVAARVDLNRPGVPCNPSSGEAFIRRVRFDRRGRLRSLDADFVHTCDSGRDVLRGTVTWVARR